MDNQHRKIAGYRELSADEIAAMNEAKALGEQIGAFIERMRAGSGRDENVSVDLRWLSIAQTQLQQGVMALVRSIAQPSTF